VYKKVLLPLDGSPLAEGVLPLLMEIAGPLDMAIVLLRVIEPTTPLVLESGRSISVDDVDVRRRDAEEYLAPIAAGLRARGVETSWEVRVGRADEEILAAARAAGADLVAMSTHGRSGLGRLLFGSVAEQVLRHAEVPVFLMRQTNRSRRGVPHGVEVKR
jgi:nucleotide-binding universal stress UspA family protein